MAVHGARQKIHEAVLGWPGVTAHPHRFGGTEYRLSKRELGHIHGDYLVDIPFLENAKYRYKLQKEFSTLFIHLNQVIFVK